LLRSIMPKNSSKMHTPLPKVRKIYINSQKDLEKAYSIKIAHKRTPSLRQ
jgi:hypothetical protein